MNIQEIALEYQTACMKAAIQLRADVYDMLPQEAHAKFMERIKDAMERLQKRMAGLDPDQPEGKPLDTDTGGTTYHGEYLRPPPIPREWSANG